MKLAKSTKENKMDKYNDSQFANAFSHAQMMQKELRRKRFNAVDLDQTSREIEHDKKAFIAQQNARYERELKKQFDAESAESLQAVVHVIMRALGMIAVATFLYLIFISFAGN